MSLELSPMPAAWLWSYVAVVGACVGSFLNVVIHRLPREQSILSPPSTCPGCQTRIRPWDNVPILAWLWLRGRCRRCRAPISWRYPAVEAFTAGLAVLCVWRFGASGEAVALFALLAALLAVAFIDWEHMIIPDSISLGFLALGLMLAPLVGPGLLAAVVGAAVGGGLLLAIAMLWEKTRGVQAMGGGDIKLMGAVGAFLGALPALLVIFLGAFLGAVFGAAILRRGSQAKIAFGTFLSAATFLVVFFGDAVVAWYLTRAGLTG